MLATSLSAMSDKLDANHEKSSWRNETEVWLFARALEETSELGSALSAYTEHPSPQTAREVIEEAADAMNFMGMLIDNIAQREGIEYPSTEQRWVKLIRKSEDRLAKIRAVLDGKVE